MRVGNSSWKLFSLVTWFENIPKRFRFSTFFYVFFSDTSVKFSTHAKKLLIEVKNLETSEKKKEFSITLKRIPSFLIERYEEKLRSFGFSAFLR